MNSRVYARGHGYTPLGCSHLTARPRHWRHHQCHKNISYLGSRLPAWTWQGPKAAAGVALLSPLVACRTRPLWGSPMAHSSPLLQQGDLHG